jgi:hypothetical protein
MCTVYCTEAGVIGREDVSHSDSKRRHFHIHDKIHNVKYHRAGQTTKPATFSWHREHYVQNIKLLYALYRSFVRRSCIRFRIFFCIFLTRTSVVSSPSTVTTALLSWLGPFLTTSTTTLLRRCTSSRSTFSYLQCACTKLYCTACLNLLLFTPSTLC